MSSHFKISTATRQILILGAIILIVRILYVDIYQSLQLKYGFDLSEYIGNILSDHISLIALFGLNILFVAKFARRGALHSKPIKRVLLIFFYIVCVSIMITALVNRGQLLSVPLSNLPQIKGEMAFSFLSVVLVNSLVVVVVDLIFYMRTSRVALESEKDQRHKAQYQYIQLKQQLNPHFLFNSLNILDYLVQNDDKQRAAEYIRKLAGVYRYLLRQGEEPLVELSTELEFVDKYVDLLKARFDTALNVEVRIDKKYMDRKIIPCGLQILIENAVKHNVVSAEKPLKVEIVSDGDKVVVRNNLQLRYGHCASNGVGLSNLEGQYRDIAERSIRIEQTNTEFIVELPLL